MKKRVQNYDFQEVLGSGQFGNVYRAVNTTDGKTYAIKQVSRNSFVQNPRLSDFSNNEQLALQKIDNKNVVKLYEILETVNNVYFVYEYCNQGTLDDLLTLRGYLPENEVLNILNQILHGMQSLIQLNIMHRDLKPQNIFFSGSDVKIGDFGFCKLLKHENELSKTMLGSPIYMAPEILLGEEYSIKADVWSLGVIIYESLVGNCPHSAGDITSLLFDIHKKEIKFPSQIHISEPTKKLVRSMLMIKPEERISWDDLFLLQNIHPVVPQSPIVFKKANQKQYGELNVKQANQGTENQMRLNVSINNRVQLQQEGGSLQYQQKPHVINQYGINSHEPNLKFQSHITSPDVVQTTYSPLDGNATNSAQLAMETNINALSVPGTQQTQCYQQNQLQQQYPLEPLIILNNDKMTYDQIVSQYQTSKQILNYQEKDNASISPFEKEKDEERNIKVRQILKQYKQQSPDQITKIISTQQNACDETMQIVLKKRQQVLFLLNAFQKVNSFLLSSQQQRQKELIVLAQLSNKYILSQLCVQIQLSQIHLEQIRETFRDRLWDILNAEQFQVIAIVPDLQRLQSDQLNQCAFSLSSVNSFQQTSNSLSAEQQQQQLVKSILTLLTAKWGESKKDSALFEIFNLILDAILLEETFNNFYCIPDLYQNINWKATFPSEEMPVAAIEQKSLPQHYFIKDNSSSNHSQQWQSVKQKLIRQQQQSFYLADKFIGYNFKSNEKADFGNQQQKISDFQNAQLKQKQETTEYQLNNNNVVLQTQSSPNTTKISRYERLFLSPPHATAQKNLYQRHQSKTRITKKWLIGNSNSQAEQFYKFKQKCQNQNSTGNQTQTIILNLNNLSSNNEKQTTTNKKQTTNQKYCLQGIDGIITQLKSQKPKVNNNTVQKPITANDLTSEIYKQTINQILKSSNQHICTLPLKNAAKNANHNNVCNNGIQGYMQIPPFYFNQNKEKSGKSMTNLNDARNNIMFNSREKLHNINSKNIMNSSNNNSNKNKKFYRTFGSASMKMNMDEQTQISVQVQSQSQIQMQQQPNSNQPQKQQQIDLKALPQEDHIQNFVLQTQPCSDDDEKDFNTYVQQKLVPVNNQNCHR